MFYDRKIKYLEDRKGGERMRTAGFVKAEVRGEVCRMTIHVAGLYGTDTFEKNVLLSGGGREGRLCKIKIAEGQGDSGELSLHSGYLGEAGIPYAQLEAIRIPLAAGRELCCIWKQKAEAAAWANAAAESEVKPASLEDIGDEEPRAAQAADMERDVSMGETTGRREETAEAKAPFPLAATEGVLAKPELQADTASEHPVSLAPQGDAFPESPAQRPAVGTLPAGASAGISAGVYACRRPPMEDKWNQLAAIYPHIAPFRDEREYLSIHPEDFVLFPAKFYPLVHNSFLLHGYHNYTHLILARLERRGEMRHYIGVPGVYHEKERQAAVLFGFESFECKMEPARPGDYGYYMIRVEL